MKTFVIITTPRARGDLLVRMLAAAPGCACANADGLLKKAKAFDDSMGAIAVGSAVTSAIAAAAGSTAGTRACGIADRYAGHEGWRDAVGLWSWLLLSAPDLHLIFLSRDQAETELSMEATSRRWVPSYGTCAGKAGKRMIDQVRSMEDFHLMNPTRTMLLDSSDLLHFDMVRPRLAALGLELDRAAWESAIALVTHDRKTIAAERPPHDEIDWDLIPVAEPVGRASDVGPAETLDEVAQRVGLVPGRPRRFVEPERTGIPRAICIPWLASAAKWEELKHALRSIDRHWSDRECPIFILGPERPQWLAEDSGRVKFIPIDYTRGKRRGLHEAFRIGTTIADEVAWWNDDIYLLKDAGWEDLRVAVTEGCLDGKVSRMLTSPNGWQRALGEACLVLHHYGIKSVMRFATHTPYLFEREKSLEIFRKFRLPFKGGWVTYYHGWHGTPHQPIGRLKVNQLTRVPAEAIFLNHSDRTLTAGLKAAIAERFSTPAPWELPG
jgi:hypothetical protein